MTTLEKALIIVDEQLKYFTTKDEIGQFPNSISNEFDEHSQEGKKALEIITNFNLIYFKGNSDNHLHMRIAEITDEGREALKVGIIKYIETIHPTRKPVGFTMSDD